MNKQLLSPNAAKIEEMLESPTNNNLQRYVQQEAVSKVEAQGFAPSDYQIFAVRHNEAAGSEVFGPHNLHVGNYSESSLYGAVGSPLPRFRSAIRNLLGKATQIGQLAPEEIEYSYQTTLFWTDIGKLKDFLGVSTSVSEIVGELLTARFQYLGKDTPVEAINALVNALTMIAEANRLDAALIDHLMDALEAGGIDSLAPDALRKPNA